MPHLPLVTVQYAAAGWNTKLGLAIGDQNYVRIVVKGALASDVKSKLSFPQVCMVPSPPFSGVPIPYPNLTNALSSVPLLLGHVVTACTVKGYKSIKTSYDAHGAGASDNELKIDLR